MAHDYTQAATGRAAAILTTGEVAGAAFFLPQAKDAAVTVDLSFTIGSLTNVTVRFYGSADGVTYDPIYGMAGAGAISGGDGTVAGALQPVIRVLTASAEAMIPVPALPGVKWFRVSVQGSGTLTSSSCAFVYRFTKLGAP